MYALKNKIARLF